MPRSDLWSGLVVAAFGVVALVWAIPNYAGSNPFAQMPPELVPSIAAWVMVVCGGVVAAGGLLQLLRERIAPVTAEIDWRGVGWSLWPFLYVGAAVWVIGHVRITWAGPVVIALMLVLLGERRWWMLLGCSVVPPALLYFLSVYLMRIGVV